MFGLKNMKEKTMKDRLVSTPTQLSLSDLDNLDGFLELVKLLQLDQSE